jgi:pimeloyl-ACP methyl ester carboxylesterase
MTETKAHEQLGNDALAIPIGRRVDLPGRGTTFVREVPGPPGAPVLVLLHGWIASGGVNWYQVFEPLGRHFRVIAPDLRGHGRGLRNNKRFRLADCADDVAALLDVLEIDQAVMVGYSMGGPVAQLTWHRHRDKVSGLVLCATSLGFVPQMQARLIFTTMMTAAAGTTRLGQLATMLPRSLAKQYALAQGKGRPDTLREWARGEMARHDWRMVMEAGNAIGRYNATKWIGDIDVPTSVLITTKDRAIEPSQQAKMAFAIPHATIHRVEDGHLVCASPLFIDPLLAACHDVTVKAYPGFVPDRRRVSREGN